MLMVTDTFSPATTLPALVHIIIVALIHLLNDYNRLSLNSHIADTRNDYLVQASCRLRGELAVQTNSGPFLNLTDKIRATHSVLLGTISMLKTGPTAGRKEIILNNLVPVPLHNKCMRCTSHNDLYLDPTTKIHNREGMHRTEMCPLPHGAWKLSKFYNLVYFATEFMH